MSSKLATLFGLVAAASLVVGFLQWREKERLVAENAQLRSAVELVPIESTSPPPQEVDPDKNSAAADKLELLRLRNEVRQLRESAKELEKLRAELSTTRGENSRLRTTQAQGGVTGTNGPGFLAKESWTFAGYSTPEAALQSWLYSTANGDLANSVASLVPEQQPELKEGNETLTPEKFALDAKKGAERLAGFEIVGRESPSADDVVLVVRVHDVNGHSRARPIQFKRIGAEWKLVNYTRMN
jgi:hypothetical protein